MESCLAALETEAARQAYHKTRAAARHDLFAYIAGYYNRQRLAKPPNPVSTQSREGYPALLQDRCPLSRQQASFAVQLRRKEIESRGRSCRRLPPRSARYRVQKQHSPLASAA